MHPVIFSGYGASKDFSYEGDFHAEGIKDASMQENLFLILVFTFGSVMCRYCIFNSFTLLPVLGCFFFEKKGNLSEIPLLIELLSTYYTSVHCSDCAIPAVTTTG